MPATRKFDGKTYTRHFGFSKKSSATNLAKSLRGSRKVGKRQRVVKSPVSARVVRGKLSNGKEGWIVYTRRR